MCHPVFSLTNESGRGWTTLSGLSSAELRLAERGQLPNELCWEDSREEAKTNTCSLFSVLQKHSRCHERKSESENQKEKKKEGWEWSRNCRKALALGRRPGNPPEKPGRLETSNRNNSRHPMKIPLKPIQLNYSLKHTRSETILQHWLYWCAHIQVILYA